MNVLFQYPNGNHEDILVWEEKAAENSVYHIGIEGHIRYPNLEEAISYITKLKDMFADWVEQKGYVRINQASADYVYKTHGVTIYDEGDGVMVYLDGQTDMEMHGLLDWLEGAIAEIQENKDFISLKAALRRAKLLGEAEIKNQDNGGTR